MDLKVAEKFAREKMAKHLTAGWRFKWDTRATKRFGQCRVWHRTGRREIGISSKLVAINNESEVFDTILHEIAHGMAHDQGIRIASEGHGFRWEGFCRQIGARTERCYSSANVVAVKQRYSGKCSKCGAEFETAKLPVRTAYHTACNQNRAFDYPIKYVDNKKNSS